jgi:hypothetical protein
MDMLTRESTKEGMSYKDFADNRTKHDPLYSVKGV